MKYMLIALAVVFVFTGCTTSSHSSSPGQANYSETSNDRHSMNRVSNNLRPSSSIWYGR